MKREEFLKLISLLGASAIFNSIIPKKAYSIENKKNLEDEIIIIGAGASGLYTAYLLKQKGYKVKIIEANNRIGGRIYTLENFSEVPIELGAEFINGKNILRNIAKKSKVKLTLNDSEKGTYLFLDKEMITYNDLPPEDLKKISNLIVEIANYKGNEQTLENFFTNQQLSKLERYFYKVIGIEAGASTKEISIKAISQIFQKTGFESETEFIYKSPTPYFDIFKYHQEFLKDDIILNTEIKAIDYTDKKIKIYDQNNNQFDADKVIITVPLPVLKDKINFLPRLPEEKQKAIDELKMGPGMKVILKFDKPFWNRNLKILEGFSYATYWTHKDPTILTAFAVGEHADKINQDPISILLKDLNTIFKINLSKKNLVNYHIMDWTKEKLIGGYCCYPNTSSFFENKEDLAKSINNQLFFAGEATNTNPKSLNYVHGAIETAEKVVKEILALS